MKRYYYSTDGSPSAGPVTTEELQQLSDSGQLAPTTVVAEENSNGEWVLVSSLIPSSPPRPTATSITASSTKIEPFYNSMTSPSSNLSYKVVVLTTGCFSGTLDPNKLQQTLNNEAKGGWRFARSIHEQKKILGLFSREAHFLVFERGA